MFNTIKITKLIYIPLALLVGEVTRSDGVKKSLLTTSQHVKTGIVQQGKGDMGTIPFQTE